MSMPCLSQRSGVRPVVFLCCMLYGLPLLAEPAAVVSTAQNPPSPNAQDDLDGADENGQDSIPGDDLFAEEITVLGQQIERPLQDTEASVAVVVGADIEASTATDLYDLVALTPNVSQSFGNRGFSIRGIDQRGSGSGSGLLLSVNVDGASLQNDASTFFGPYSAWDLHQVEIFRGPQSTQQGRNSLAGAIILRSADPTYEREVKGRWSLGSFETSQASATVNLPIVQHKAAFRLSIDQRKSDGWVDNPTRGEDDYDFRDALTVRGKLRFDPTDRFSGLLTLSYTDSRGGEDVIDPLRFPDDRFNTSDEDAEEGSEHQIATLELSYLLDDNWRLETTSNLYLHDYLRLEDGDQSPLPGNFLDQTAEDSSFSQQVRLHYRGGERTSAVFGVYYATIEDRGFSSATIPGTFFGLPPFVSITGTLDQRQDTENLAVFGEFDFRLTDRLTLTAGARFDQEEQRTRNLQSFTVDPPVISLPPQPAEDLSTTYDAFLPKLALTYDWTDQVAVGGSIQQGYRAGGRSIAFISQQVNDYDPETTTNYEIFVRSRSADRRWQLNANGFYIDWQDQQVTVRTDLGLENDVLTINAGTSRLFGFETEMIFQPHRQLRLFSSLGFVDASFIEFVDGDRDLSGNTFPYAPEWSWAVGGRWTLAERWSLNANVSYQSPFFSEESNAASFEVDERWLANLKLGYDFGSWGLHLFASNLFDEDYLLQRIDGGARSGAPRVVGVEWTFGL